MVLKKIYRRTDLFSANVPSDLSLLAFGIPPACGAESAGGMPKVPKGQGLGRLACSHRFSLMKKTTDPISAGIYRVY
jgi:hypothetical protein